MCTIASWNLKRRKNDNYCAKVGNTCLEESSMALMQLALCLCGIGV
jgi:hypothetical protein